MENAKRDIRLYEYDNGTLRKTGRGKTGARPHLFDTIEKCEGHIAFLREKYKSNASKQYLIVEYFGAYDSQIIKLD